MNDKLITYENLGRFYDDLNLNDIAELDGKISNLIKDTSTANNSTWSSSKINSEIQAHSGATYTAGNNININSENVISAIFNLATTAEIEALFVLPSFYVDNALFETYNLTWGQWLDSKYNTSGFTHIYTASTYDSSVEQIPEVVSSAYPTAGGHYYSTCTDTYVPATAPADNEIWYTTESGNLWEPYYDSGEGEQYIQNTLLKVNDGSATIISNTYANGHGVIKYSEPITSLNDGFGEHWDSSTRINTTDLTTLVLPNSIASVNEILEKTTPELEAIHYNGTVAECEEINWDSFDSNSANGIEEIICLDGTYSLSDEGGGTDYGGGGGY